MHVGIVVVRIGAEGAVQVGTPGGGLTAGKERAKCTAPGEEGRVGNRARAVAWFA